MRPSDSSDQGKALECFNVRKSYVMSKEVIVEALRGVTFSVRYGEMVSIMGPSGSGKSTLLHVLGTLDKPTEGSVFVDGQDTTRLSEKELGIIRRDKIGFVFQFFNLLTNLSALDNVVLPMVLSNRYSVSEAKKRARLLLRLVGLPESRLKNKPRQLSGGQQQMVAIARAISNNPTYVLTDEPTGNLDVESSVRVTSTMRMINQLYGQTFIIVTHNPDVARVAGKVYFMRDGMLSETPSLSLAPKGLAEAKLWDEEKLKLHSELLELEERSLRRRFLEGRINESELERNIRRLYHLMQNQKRVEKV